MNEAETQRLETIYQRKLAALAELKKALLHRRLPENSRKRMKDEGRRMKTDQKDTRS